ncbi:hypothetical protein C8R43DRAFT_1140842 [Mycena crocata]|nr:hypothetical protein C8R43DRAFT_1140842 [Mycena crocata]
MTPRLPTAHARRGTSLLKSGNYTDAANEFSEAIKEPRGDKNPVLYSQRAACYYALEKYEEGLTDLKRAIQLDPTNAKAWYNMGVCEDGLRHYNESIRSYQQAMAYTSVPVLLRRSQAALKSAEKNYKLDKIPLNVMKALARAHDIQLSLSSNNQAIYRTLSKHPLFGTEPKLRLLFIPESPDAPVLQLELARGPGTDTKAQIAAVIRCKFTDCVMLHSEDQIAYARGKHTGVDVGRLHTSYEAWMDDDAVGERPLNKRASMLLHRPKTYGPILVQKTTFIKSDSQVQSSNDIICFEKLSENELLSDRFRHLREEWLKLMGTGDAPIISRTYQTIQYLSL